MPFTTLQRTGRCVICGVSLAAGGRAFYEPQSRSVSCTIHHGQDPGPVRRAVTPSTADEEFEIQQALYTTPFGLGDAATGSVSSSARVYADKVKQEHKEKLRQQWGPLAGIIGMLRQEDGKVKAARRGAEGEERLAKQLDAFAGRHGQQVRVLHDRTIPGRRENVDHLVVCPSGVWAVDAKAYSGQIATGGLFSKNRQLVIAGRDKTSLVQQSLRQQSYLRDHLVSLGSVPVLGALCFVGGKWAPFTKGSRVSDVLVCPPGHLLQNLKKPGPLTEQEIARVTAHLDAMYRRASW